MPIAPDEMKVLRTLSDQVVRFEGVDPNLDDVLRRFEDAGLVRAVQSDDRRYMVLTGSGILAARLPREKSRRPTISRRAAEAVLAL